MSTLLTSVEWLSNQFGRNLWLTPSVLTLLNSNDHSAPKMSPVEAEGVFQFLVDKKLIFPIVDSNKRTVFLMNEVEEQRWKDAIRELKQPWIHSVTAKRIGLGILWLVSLIISSYLGAGFKEAGKDSYRSKFPEEPKGAATEDSVTQIVDARLAAREAANVQALAPKFQEIYRDMLPDYAPPADSPTTYLELLKPAIRIVTEVSTTTEAPSKTPSTEQDGAEQPATAPESKPEGEEKPNPELEERSQ